MRILIVEDDAMIGASLVRGLTDEGYVVDWVRDGGQAEAALIDRHHEFHLVLLDLGADDFLVKPFELTELKARIRALARRHAGRIEPQLKTAVLTLDPAARCV